VNSQDELTGKSSYMLLYACYVSTYIHAVSKEHKERSFEKGQKQLYYINKPFICRGL
jgi:hypothetical protein